MFPIDIQFNRHVRFDNPKSQDWIIKLVVSKLENLKVDKIIVIDSHIDFKNSLFNGQGNWNLMAPINQGHFNYNISTSTITYRVSTLRILVFALILSCIMGLLGSSIVIGLLMLLWLYGLNWMILIVRHRKFFNRLIKEIKTKNYFISN